MIKPIPPKYFFIVGVFIAPFFEELSCRYPLKYNKNALFIAFLAYIIIVFCTSISAMDRISNMTDFSFKNFNFESQVIRSFLWSIIYALLIFVATRFNKINKILSKFWDKYLIVVVYISAAYFAYLHFPLPKTGINWVWLPVLVAPQFFSALYFSYIRLRVKFSYCVFLHMILNGVALFPDLFAQ
jgi:hypothetical protein